MAVGQVWPELASLASHDSGHTPLVVPELVPQPGLQVPGAVHVIEAGLVQTPVAARACGSCKAILTFLPAMETVSLCGKSTVVTTMLAVII